MKKLELVGNRFGRLLITEQAESDKKKNTQWLCLCDCGKTVIVRCYQLTSGKTKSCGCLRKEMIAALGRSMKKHGNHIRNKPTKAYKTWQGIKTRCCNKNSKDFEHYGARGIKVCDRWINSFESFLEDMGNPSSSDLQIDRIDNEGNYEPGNCRWTTAKINQNNKRNSLPLISFNGLVKSVAEWNSYLGFNPRVLYKRLYEYSYTIERALTEPMGFRYKERMVQ